MWKQEVSKEQTKLREEAQKAIQSVRRDKNDIQKIRLILNVIAPDNFERKFAELRKYLFGELRSK